MLPGRAAQGLACGVSVCWDHGIAFDICSLCVVPPGSSVMEAEIGQTEIGQTHVIGEQSYV